MNANRRRAIEECIAKINDAEYIIGEMRDVIESIRDDEEEAHDNLPESLQDSEKGEAMQEAIGNLESALDSIEGLDFDDIIGALQDAQS